ncbi:hypothetical protein OS493_036335 [Desmophyllum pertusum]|uniref:Uncharacterized protein n=1 Tax=Desmophyllum pertusum TaxID=174260 RepID=A0A9W9YLF6_9CNID|nr:hypothetical protein OS493_036335 [Desmophyllum pertusum]
MYSTELASSSNAPTAMAGKFKDDCKRSDDTMALLQQNAEIARTETIIPFLMNEWNFIEGVLEYSQLHFRSDISDKLKSFVASTNGNTYYRCTVYDCPVFVGATDVMEYCQGIVMYLHKSYKEEPQGKNIRPYCLCERGTSLRVALKTEKVASKLKPFFTCGQQEKCDYFQWAVYPLTEKNAVLHEKILRKKLEESSIEETEPNLADAKEFLDKQSALCLNDVKFEPQEMEQRTARDVIEQNWSSPMARLGSTLTKHVRL